MLRTGFLGGEREENLLKRREDTFIKTAEKIYL